jgi:hypothetical protein
LAVERNAAWERGTILEEAKTIRARKQICLPSVLAKHLRWPEAKVRAAVNYAEAFPEEIDEATAENDSADFETLKRMLPQVVAFASRKTERG